MKGPEEAVVVGGVIDKTLNRTSASERGTLYDVIYTYPNAAARGLWLEEPLGSISLTGPGPVALADLLAIPAPVPIVPDALAQALGAAASAQAAAESTVPVLEDRLAAEAASVAAAGSAAQAQVAAGLAAAEASAQIAPAVAAAGSAQAAAAASAAQAQAALEAAIAAGTWNYTPVDNAALAAITGMTSGQTAYVRQTMHVWSYNGSAWVDTGESPLAAKADKTALMEKQELIFGATVSRVDFAPYLMVGSINATTGELEGTTFGNRRSIVKMPLNLALTYRIQNSADLLSNLRIAYFNSAGALITPIVLRTAGQMADYTLVPPSTAASVSIGLKSGNTDLVLFDPGRVNFFSSTDGTFSVNKVNGFPLMDTRADRIAVLDGEVFPVSHFSAWLQYGISGTGGLNAITTQSHSPKLPVSGGDVLTISGALPIYRVNHFDAAGAFISQAPASPAFSYTVPSGLGIASVMISVQAAYDVNAAILTTSHASSAITRLNERMTAVEEELADVPGLDALTGRVTALEANGVTDVIAGGSASPKSGNQVTLLNSTAMRSGLMSAADKAKLDSLVPGSITIEGSGVYKNAAAFGFLPTNNATENVAAMRAAVAGGGLIFVDIPGTYDVNASILLDSGTGITFGPGVVINKVSLAGRTPRYTFINRGAFTKEWNDSIGLYGLRIKCNGIGNGADDTTAIPGLRGHVAFHYIRNLFINDFYMNDGDAVSYVIHICTFLNIAVTRSYIEGWKDAVHLGNGDCYLIRDCRFMTYDDPIALNAHDYATGQPELGWLTNGLIENCYDLADPVRGTTGFFARILAGAWVDWFAGMQVRQSDTIVASNGKMYRVFNANDGTVYTSNTEPSHASGTVTIDGINWRMIQENGVTYSVGVRDVTFRNIYLQKPRGTGLSIHFDNDNFSRSYYPGAVAPVQDGIILDGIHMQADIPTLISAITPIGVLKILNSDLRQTRINLTNIGTAGIAYNPVNILMMGNTYLADAPGALISTASGRTARAKILGSVKLSDAYVPTFGAGVTVLASDLAA
ncbi:hypothetical protein M3484_02010 [Pseudomonas sp. GX19020]|uniref:hypothetical protein n=1 Tax=Pseudomonas sp. GX19020 TaxID=2942277 RepID=UPI002018D8DC|nr:hypothetical protein [Pseudomonas sp. GX19020]MCL4065351.1 hypothetical protein [Pseudomonas sp. GX19020]